MRAAETFSVALTAAAVIFFLMRRIIFTSLAVIALIAIIAPVWVGAGERLFLFLDSLV